MKKVCPTCGKMSDFKLEYKTIDYNKRFGYGKITIFHCEQCNNNFIDTSNNIRNVYYAVLIPTYLIFIAIYLFLNVVFNNKFIYYVAAIILNVLFVVLWNVIIANRRNKLFRLCKFDEFYNSVISKPKFSGNFIVSVKKIKHLLPAMLFKAKINDMDCILFLCTLDLKESIKLNFKFSGSELPINNGDRIELFDLKNKYVGEGEVIEIYEDGQ